MFDLAEAGDDRRVGKDDLAAVAPRLAAWGVREHRVVTFTV